MGVVYKAEDTRLQRVVALKFLPPELTRDAAAKERFLVEARAASAIDHPGVCAVHEIDETADGALFICMAYCEGETLRTRLQRGRLGVDSAVITAIQVAEALHAAHGKGIVHRDVKPANIVVGSDGKARLLDFGLALLVAEARLTEPGFLLGTGAYLSPEQAWDGAVDWRTDIWSLGVVLYEMLAGTVPFAGDTLPALARAIRYSSPRPLAEVRPDVPGELESIVARCLAKSPSDRFQSAAEVFAELRRLRRRLRAPSTTQIDRVTPPAPSLGRRFGPAVAGAGLGLVALAVFVAGPALRDSLTASALPDRRHVAVLEFTNVGGDVPSRAFCDGVTEVAASKLSELEQYQGSLSVVPVAEIRRMEVHSPGEARRAFGVNLVVTGSVQRHGTSVRIALNLVDAATMRQKRSKVVSEFVGDLAAAEDRVVDALVSMFDVELDAPARRQVTAGGTRTGEAYDVYVQGLGTLFSQRGPGDPEAAAVLFQRAIARDPGFALAHAGLAEAHRQRYGATKAAPWIEAASASARRAVELGDSLADPHVTLGLVLTDTGRYEDAAGQFRRAIAIEARNGAAYKGLARALERLGRSAEAETAYRKAVSLRPDDWLGYAALGNFYLRQARHDEAIAQHRKVISLTPENYWGYNNLGAVYYSLGRNDEARAMFERSAAIRPNYPALSNAGTILFQASAFREAAPLFERALAINSGDYVLWGNLATCYFYTPGQKDRAMPAFTRAAELGEDQRKVNPREPQVLADLAGYYGILGQRERGTALLAQVVRERPDSADLMCSIGQSYEDLGDRTRALEWIGKALRAGYPRPTIERSPALTSLTGDPRYRSIVDDLGSR